MPRKLYHFFWGKVWTMEVQHFIITMRLPHGGIVPVLFDDIEKWFKDSGWHYVRLESGDQQRICFYLEFSGSLNLNGEVAVSEEGQFIQFRIAEIFSRQELESSPYRRRIMAAFSEESFNRRLAKIGYDPGDGEIDYCVDFPLEDCALTRRQFEHVLHLLILLSRLVHKRVKTILDTGRDPGLLNVDDLPKP